MALNKLRHFSKYVRPTATAVSKLNYSKQNVIENEAPRMNLDEKIAVVTGGAEGIGYAIAKQFLKDGMGAVTIVDNDKPKCQKSVQKLADEFGEDKVLFMEADVGNTQQMDLAFKNTIFHYDSIDIIVNNAGIMDDTHWEAQIKTNLHGCVIGTLLGMQYMAKTSSGQGGTIVNIGSVISIMPSSGYPIYTMTQFGIAGFTNALGSSKLYERTGVKILGYCPGLTDTKLMKDAARNSINDNFASEFQEEIEGCVIQKPESVAVGLIGILEEAKSGSIWVVENNERPYEIKFPNVANVKDKKIDVQ